MCLKSVGDDPVAVKLSEDAGEEGEGSRSVILESAREAGTQEPGPRTQMDGAAELHLYRREAR